VAAVTTACPPTARGFPLTPSEAAELIGVSRNVIDVWSSRGDLPRAADRPVLYWSDDVYDARHRLRRKRDQSGKFARRITPL
jgi:predicted site-specific integrase-resolvase